MSDSLAAIVAELRALTPASRVRYGLLADRLEALSRSECTIVHSDPPTAPDFLAVGTVNQWREMCGD